MTKQEAIKAMSEGNKVRHLYFSSDEWVMMLADGTYQFEDGVRCSPPKCSGMIEVLHHG